jgi:outer membrane protein OmpU
VTVSGVANLTYTGNTGAQDSPGAAGLSNGQDGARWGLNQSITFAGSGEMDNGWTVSISNTLANGSSTGVGMTIDMGDAGSLNYESSTGARGVGKIKDMMPTADEDVANGLDANGTATGGEVSGTIAAGTTGFHYSKAMDMVEIGVGYAPKGGSTAAQGGVTGPGATASATSAFIKIDPMDGLEIGYGVGEYTAAGGGDANLTDDVDTAYVTYVYGPVTFGYQQSTTDTNDTTATTADDEQTRWGVLYAVNDELSISYQDHENDDSTNSVTEEATGVSMSYTVGSMTFKAHRNKGTNLGNATTRESEHTEVGVTFAF